MTLFIVVINSMSAIWNANPISNPISVKPHSWRSTECVGCPAIGHWGSMGHAAGKKSKEDRYEHIDEVDMCA